MENKDYIIRVPYAGNIDTEKGDNIADLIDVISTKATINCVNWKEQFPYHPITSFGVVYTDDYLYIDFFVRCNYLRAVNYKNNSNVCEDSCVEFFMQLPGNDEYWNFEFNCIGAVNASHRSDRKNPHRLSDDEIASIKRVATCGAKPFEELEGLFSWGLTVGIPFKLIGINLHNTPIEIFANFYKCASGTSMPHYLSWAPIPTPKPDFHRPEYFGRLLFEPKGD